MKNCSCPVCYEHQSANEYYRMTVHTNEYHKLLFKIHEKIEYWEKEESKASYSMYALEIEILKSLLEDK